ncbi:MAG: aminotransferase class V-fold PLP-dependent enzyme, partial [Caldilineaceae bacterium]|nr:aminotransferase class V-fold PLP-dependent enzyme [Caldilineaceae bacterium]
MHSNSSLLTDVHNRIRAYTSAINDRAVFPTPAALDALSELDTPLPDDPTDPAQVLDMLDEIGSPATVATSGGRYFGFVTGGVLPAAQAAALLAAAWDQNGGLSVMSPIAAQLEQLALGWLVDLLQLPAGTGGGFVTGATMANFSALAAARHALLERQGWNVEADGLFGAPPLQVVVGDEVHASLLKALSMIGFGRARVTSVPVDGQGRMRADALPALNEHTILCIQAGNVNTGAFDPAADLCQAAQQAGAWVHVDGAFGLWA